MSNADWIKVLLIAAPVVATTYGQCKRAGITPGLPVLGLLIGVVLEMQRNGA